MGKKWKQHFSVEVTATKTKSPIDLFTHHPHAVKFLQEKKVQIFIFIFIFIYFSGQLFCAGLGDNRRTLTILVFARTGAQREKYRFY